MKGTTHAALGVATAYAISGIPYTQVVGVEDIMLPILAGYIGALLLDLDTGQSTISNLFIWVKLKHLKYILALTFFSLGMAAIIHFNETIYKYLILAIMGITAVSFSKIATAAYRIVKKVILVIGILLLLGAGLKLMHPPLFVIAIVLMALMISPHRGYSHSLIAAIICFIVTKYTCTFYRIADLSIYLATGILTHILADMFTEKGVELLFPYRKRVKLPYTIKTGSASEYIFVFLSLLIFSLKFRS